MKKQMALLNIVIVLLCILPLSACSKDQAAGKGGENADQYKAQRNRNKYLAYEHSVTIVSNAEKIEKQHKLTIKTCTESREYKCIILDTKIDTGDYSGGHITLRVDPTGVNKIIQTASDKGEIRNKSTHVEDLAKPIMDSTKRQSMLETHRDQLIELQQRPDNDIDSLIRISSELARVQSELEHAKADNTHLLKRVRLDLVNLYFEVSLQRSFWKPISKALKNFSGDLSRGISGTISAIGYFFPWLIAVIVTLLFCRFVWRKTSKKQYNTSK